MKADNTKPQKIFSSLKESITSETDVTIVGKRASVCGYGGVCTSALRGSGARKLCGECDSFCALQAGGG